MKFKRVYIISDGWGMKTGPLWYGSHGRLGWAEASGGLNGGVQGRCGEVSCFRTATQPLTLATIPKLCRKARLAEEIENLWLTHRNGAETSKIAMGLDGEIFHESMNPSSELNSYWKPTQE